MSIAPVAPIGWPSAIAPPLTLHLSQSAPVSLQELEHDGGERLVDLDQVDVVDRHAGLLRGNASAAGPGAVSMITGSVPATAVMHDARPRRRARAPSA